MNNTISWHRMGLSSLYAYFFSSPEGLSQREAQKRRTSDFEAEKQYQKLLLSTLSGLPLAYLSALFMIAIFCILNGYMLAGGLGLVSASLYAFVLIREAQHRADWTVMLGNLNREKVMVLRDGEPKAHLPSDLVLGDVILINPHMVMPVTVRLIEATDLEVAQSLTHPPVRKQARNYTKEESVVSKILFAAHKTNTAQEEGSENLVIAGSWVSHGAGKGIIIDIPEENKTLWVDETFHADPLLTWDSFLRPQFILSAVAAFLVFFVSAIVLEDKSHGFLASILASLGFVVLLYPITANLLLVHDSNLQIHQLLRKQIMVRNAQVFQNLGNTSFIVADAEYLFANNLINLSQLMQQGLQFVVFSEKPSDILAAQIRVNGGDASLLMTHQEFENHSDREMQERLKASCFISGMNASAKNRLLEILKLTGTSFIMIGERDHNEPVIPREMRLLLANQAASALTKNATDILLYSDNIPEFLSILLTRHQKKSKLLQSEALLKSLHYFCATAVILAFLVGGGMGEFIVCASLGLLGLWYSFA